MRNGTAVRATLGGIVSLVALFLVVRSVDLQATANLLRSADLRWIGFAWVLIVLDLSLRGLRWQRVPMPC